MKEEETCDLESRVETEEKFPLDYYQCALYFSSLEDKSAGLVRKLEAHAAGIVRRFSSSTAKERKCVCGQIYTRYRMLLVLLALVSLQVTLMHQLLFSVEHRSCSSARDCVRGTSCFANIKSNNEHNVCAACRKLKSGNETRRIESECFDVFDSEILLRKYARNQVPSVEVQWKKGASRKIPPRTFLEFCAGCIDADGSYKTLQKVTRSTLRAMRIGDFLTLFVCSAAVGLAIVGEVREIKINFMAQKRHYKDTLSRAAKCAHLWFTYMLNVRIFLLVPQIVSTIPRLVLLQGSDTVSVIFNSVSIIFVIELDNLVTERLISIPTRRRLEHNQVLVRPTNQDYRYLAMISKLYILGALFAVFLGLYFEVWLQMPGISFLFALAIAFTAGLFEVFHFEDQPHFSRVLFNAIFLSRFSTNTNNTLKIQVAAAAAAPPFTRDGDRSSSSSFDLISRVSPHRSIRAVSTIRDVSILLLDCLSFTLEFLFAAGLPVLILNFLTGPVFLFASG